MRAAIVGPQVLAVATVASGQQPALTEEDVTFQNGDVRVAGTLTLPAGRGPHPAVILVSGSGPQNRDSLLFGYATLEKAFVAPLVGDLSAWIRAQSR